MLCLYWPLVQYKHSIVSRQLLAFDSGRMLAMLNFHE
jgi:hypothetical protein